MSFPYNAEWHSTIKISLVLLMSSALVFLPIFSAQGSGLAITISLVGNDDVFGPGESVFVITEIRNSESSGRVDVIVTYSILDGETIIVSETTTVAIETLSSFSQDIKVPSTVESGTYLLKASVTSLDKTKYSEAAQTINILKIAQEGQLFLEYLMGIALICTFGALFFEHRRITQMKMEKSDLEKYVKKGQ